MKYSKENTKYTERLNELGKSPYERERDKDLASMTDAEFAKKYPEVCEEYLTEEEIKEIKPVLLYQLEQSIVYLEEGGHIPKREGGGKIESDLRINHPPTTVKTRVITLREDYIGNSDNNPKNNPDDGDPTIWIYDADDKDWEPINLRRIHHVFDMNLRKWNKNQHWLLYKFSKYSGEVDYFEFPDNMPDKFPSKESQILNNYPMKNKVNLTLKPDIIPEEPEQEIVPDIPKEARWENDCKITLWNMDKEEWVTMMIGQIYHINWELAESEMPDPRDNPEFKPEDLQLKPERGRPSNWEELRDSLETEPRWDND